MGRFGETRVVLIRMVETFGHSGKRPGKTSGPRNRRVPERGLVGHPTARPSQVGGVGRCCDPSGSERR